MKSMQDCELFMQGMLVEAWVLIINFHRHDNMTYEEIALQYPKDFAERDQDKLRYRYPFGESYIDVCT